MKRTWKYEWDPGRGSRVVVCRFIFVNVKWEYRMVMRESRRDSLRKGGKKEG